MADPTTYIVLRRNGAAWMPDGPQQQAASAEAAVRAAAALRAETDTDPAGEYVAVPFRSWKPVTVKAEVVTTLKLENVGA